MSETILKTTPTAKGTVETALTQDRRATRNPFITRIIGGPFNGDYWRSATREEALMCHAEEVASRIVRR